jgi:hypothetical protein
VNELIKKLSPLSSEKEYVELAVDLNDISESSNKIERLIKALLSSSLDKEKVTE